MKKVLVFGLVCTLFLTGCGGKKLTCTMSETEEGNTMEEKIVLTFDKEGKEIQKGSRSLRISVDEEYAELLSYAAESAEEEFEDIKDFAKVDIKSSDNSLKVEVSYNTKGLTEDQLEALEDAEVYASEVSYDEMKEELTESGYTCK